jgi:hypothetical protein
MTKLLNEKNFPRSTRTSKKRFRPKIPNISLFRELSALLYIQTLVDKSKAQKKEEKDKAVKADDPKAGADVGKFVNLMAGDANRVWIIIYFLLGFLLIPHFRLHIQHLRSIFFMEAHTISPNSRASYSYSFSAPFKLLIGGIFLYQSVRTLSSTFFSFLFGPRRLLGLSAFAGCIVLLAEWPLNSYISHRSIRIQKGVLAARAVRRVSWSSRV